MSDYVVVTAALLLVIGAIALIRFLPNVIIEALDHLVLHMPIRPFLAMTPTSDPVLRLFVMAMLVVCGFGLVLSLARLTGFWIIWPAAALVLLCAVGFGVAFASMLWPVVLTAGLIVLRYALGLLERAGGELVPFPDDGPRASALNIMIGLTALLSTYASTLASRARDVMDKQSERH